jgi:formylglycine-generating enzyme required for sulfatase activity
MKRKHILIVLPVLVLFIAILLIPTGWKAKGSLLFGGQSTEVNTGPAPGTVRENPKDGLKYVWIPPGTFTMGCSPDDNQCRVDEYPSHQVTLTKGFWMGQTPVTVVAYKRFAAASGRQMPPAPKFNSGWTNENMPIVNMHWNDAHDYCAWAGGRLPTEAEWEYAARGGSKEARYGPVAVIAWFHDNSRGQTHDVGQRPANAFGLFDMLGNVQELVNDRYDFDYYQSGPWRDPPGPESGRYHVVRGASADSRDVRVSARELNTTIGEHNRVGFRCATEVVGP